MFTPTRLICIFVCLVLSGFPCWPVQTSTLVAGGKNLWTLNDSAPFHSILIRHCYLWGKCEGGGARHSTKTSSFPIYPCRLPTAGPSFVKSAVADGKVGDRKRTYRMHTGMTVILLQGKQGLKNVCDLRMWEKMNRAVGGFYVGGGCIFVTQMRFTCL